MLKVEYLASGQGIIDPYYSQVFTPLKLQNSMSWTRTLNFEVLKG